MKLPAGAGTPAADAAAAVTQATTACRAVSTITIEIAVSGSVSGHRLRARLLAGLARPASARLEAPAPFGQPVFIFVARGADATLLLPRDNRVLEHGRSDEVLEAIAGVPLDAADLRTALTGCAVAPDPARGRQLGDEWRVVPDGSGEIYLHREERAAPWRLVATIHRDSGRGDWRAEYRDFRDGLPRAIHLVSLGSGRFDLQLALSQVEINTPIDTDAFRVQIPPTADPITIEELRRAGPLG